jgi:predicted alpha/beta-fold hydrolase
VQQNERSRVVVLFHGLEGCSASHYAVSLMNHLQRAGCFGVVPHFRGCGGSANRLPRSYHIGDSQEVDWVLRRLKQHFPNSAIYAVGVSLGGNVLLKWLGERGESALNCLERAVAVSTPFDLAIAARQLDGGLNKLLYTSHFLDTMRAKAVTKLALHRLDLDAHEIRRATTFRQFDNAFTAPLHGFADAEDYWRRSSSMSWLKRIRIPVLLINARNDPFFPGERLPRATDVSPTVRREFPESGGHAGFVSGAFPGRLDWLPRRTLQFFFEN